MAYGKITRAQAVIIGAYTGILCGPFVDMQAYIEQIMGRPIFTHELADEKICEEIKAKSKKDFLDILPQ